MLEDKVEGLLLHDEEFKKLFEYIRNKERDKNNKRNFDMEMEYGNSKGKKLVVDL